MRSSKLIPIAVLAFAAACSDTATSPTSVGRPLFLVGAGTYSDVNALTANLPSGAHLQSGTINCVVGSDLSISCSGSGTYQINGVGHTNATATLSATYSATVDCTNRGGNLVEVKSQVTGAPTSSGDLAPKNGNLTVPQISAGRPTDAQFKAAATCPNGNWTKSLAPGDPTLVSFTYTLTFDGFSSPTVSIAAS